MMTVDDNDRICAVARMTAAKEKPEGEAPRPQSTPKRPQSTWRRQ